MSGLLQLLLWCEYDEYRRQFSFREPYCYRLIKKKAKNDYEKYVFCTLFDDIIDTLKDKLCRINHKQNMCTVLNEMHLMNHKRKYRDVLNELYYLPYIGQGYHDAEEQFNSY